MDVRLLVLLLICAGAYSVDKTKVGRCEVSVNFFRKSGRVESETFQYKAASKTQCRKLALEHKENFTPQWVKKKTVSSKWSKQ